MSCTILIYKSFNTSTINFDEIKSYLIEKFKSKIQIEIKENPLKNKEELAENLAKIRVTNISKVQLNEPLPAEINYEKKALRGDILPEGILYDGLEFKELLSKLINKEELKLNNLHIFLTNRLIGTFDDDKRYHARTNLLGIPSIISLTGIIEAPAKPREFYILKQKNISPDILKEKFKGKFIDYNDKRLTDILKGYIMQSIFYQLFGEAFCKDKNCKLFNAHWQEELINAQLNKTEFCEKHSKLLNTI
jgi:hypothetical protein